MRRTIVICFAVVGLAAALGRVAYVRGGKPPVTVTLLHTTDTRSALVPRKHGCDCKEGSVVMGGLSQRATLLRQLGAGRPGTLVLDSGGAAFDRRRSELVLQAMGMMGYRIIGVGRADLRLAPGFFRAARQAGLEAVCYPQTPETKEWAPTHTIRELGGRKIAIVGLGATAGYRLPLADLTALLRQLRRQCDAVVVLSQLGLQGDRDLLGRKGIGDTVDVLAGNASNATLKGAEQIRSAILVPTSFEGQQVAVITMEFARRGRPRCQWSSQGVVEDTPEDPQIEKQLAAHGVVATPFRRATGQSPQTAPGAGPVP